MATTSLRYDCSIVIVFLPQLHFCGYTIAIISMDGYIYLDPHGHGSHLKHNTQPFITLKSHQLGVTIIN